MQIVPTSILVFLLIQRIGSVSYQYKNLAGPASEFPSFTPPSLETSGMHSRYYVLPLVTLKNSSHKWTHSFPVDYCDIFAVTVFANDPKSFTVKFQSASGADVRANEVHDENIGYGSAGLYPCRTFLFNDPIPSVGEWTITVTSASSSYPVNASLIASFYPSDLILQAFVPAENLIVGRSINIIALLPALAGTMKSDNSTNSVATLENAVTIVYLPDGSEKELKMEEAPNYSLRKRSIATASDLYASFEATVAGTYKSLVRINGRLSDGTEFIRSLWYVFTVVRPSIEIVGKVKGSIHSHALSQRNIIDFNIDVHWDESELSYRAFAQVWGTRKGQEVPVAWISGLVDVQKRKYCFYNCHYIHMQLDSRWLELASAHHPLSLKSVTLEELKAYVTLSKSDALKVIADSKLMKWLPSLNALNIEVDWEMKEGYNPYRVKIDNVTNSGQILLLHGYCADNNGFLLDYFDDYLLFEDYEQNRLNDEYAKAVVDFLNERDAKRFSVVGHSQGGVVALHLYAYYQTGLDAVVSLALLATI